MMQYSKQMIIYQNLVKAAVEFRELGVLTTSMNTSPKGSSSIGAPSGG